MALLVGLIGTPGRASAQSAGLDTGGWERVVDRYLEGDRSAAGATLLKATANDIRKASDGAYERWRLPGDSDADARRLLIARLQTSALVPLDVLVVVTGRSLGRDQETAFEDAAREAWRRLAAFEDDRGGPHAAQVRRFRVWWRLAMSQQQLSSGRFADAFRDLKAYRPPDEYPDAQAAHALLRGVTLETRARLADEAPGGTAAVAMRRLPQALRVPPMLLIMEEAREAYRRALELAPGDREITLRLARVALERQRLDDVERYLAPLLVPGCRETTCGLAHLFMGEVYEARKNPDLATGAYARASSVPSVRPAALIAMIQSALRRGNAVGAYDLTRQFASPAMLVPAQTPDAWSQYVSGRLIEIERIVSHLIADVAK